MQTLYAVSLLKEKPVHSSAVFTNLTPVFLFHVSLNRMPLASRHLKGLQSKVKGKPEPFTEPLLRLKNRYSIKSLTDSTTASELAIWGLK